MKIVEHNNEAMLRATAKLEYVALSEELAVYRLTRETTLASGKLHLTRFSDSTIVTEGFAKPKSLARFASRNTPFKDLGLTVVSNEFLKELAKNGYPAALETLRKHEDNVEAYNEYSNHLPFKVLVDLKRKSRKIVEFDNGSHMVFDQNGVSLPVGIHCDYMHGRFDNAHYNLDIALKVLLKNKRVRFFEDKRTITQIPYYNVGKYSSQMLAFTYEPTKEEAQAMWEKQLSYKSKYPSTTNYQALFDLDILGLRKAGAAVFNDFHESKDYHADYNRDD